ncbi:MAG: RidA family protein [Pseudomonadota bacterium]|nr:RidA family protein [Pseudomonadota bacterium]MED5274856.1 RidA family protein [Pseudomonadota bacterium]|tara:strand:+ start:158 stop:544 length:387 start_codon:yes stop_codon:yes gene_type:complete
MKKTKISTDLAPSAIGIYSQAIRAGSFVFISGQIPLDPKSMTIIDGDINDHIKQVLSNIKAIVQESGGSMNDIVKINVYLKDLENFQNVNSAMESFFDEPFPSRAAVEVSRLPKDVSIEMDAILYVEK